MQLRKTCKSVGAVMLTIALLVGMMSVMGAFPAIAEETVDTWSFSGDWASVGGATDGTFNEANISAVDAAFNVYGGRESAVWKMDTATFGSNDPNAGSWSNSTVQLKTAATGLELWNSVDSFDGKTWRNYISLVPKTADGDEIVVRNFRATFDLQNEISWSNGGFVLQFGAEEAGRATEGENKPYGKRAAVLISAEGVSIEDGKYATVANDNYKKLFNPANAVGGESGLNLYERFPAGYNTGNGTTGGNVGFLMHVEVQVLNGKVTVTVTKDGEEAPFFTTSKTIKWDKYGYVSFTGLLRKNIVSNMSLTALNGAGEAIDVAGKQDDTFAYVADYSATTAGTTYDFSADTEANNAIRADIESKFNVYYGREHVLKQMTGAAIGTSDSEVNGTGGGSVVQLKAADNGLTMSNNVGSWDKNTMRNYISVVPKDANGDELVAKNFEISLDVKSNIKYSNGGFMLSFRSQKSGLVASNNNTPYNQKVGVYMSHQGVLVLDNPNTADATTLWQRPKYVDGFEEYDPPASSSSGDFIAHVYIKAVNEKLTISLVKAGEAIPFYEAEKTLAYDAEGTISLSGLMFDTTISNVKLNLLDENGDIIFPAEPAPDLSYMDWTFQMDNSALGSFPYDFSEDNDTNNAIRDAVDAKFNVYYGREHVFQQMTGAAIGTSDATVSGDIDGSAVQLKAAANGLATYANKNNWDKNTMRNYVSLVPKTEAGAQIVTKNFEISFDLTSEIKYDNGGFIVGFRSQNAGLIAPNNNTYYRDQVAVYISHRGVMVLDNPTTADNTNLWQRPWYAGEAFFDQVTPAAGKSTGNVNARVYIKAVNDKLTVALYNIGAKDPYLAVEKTIAYDKAGGITLSGLMFNNTVGNITLKVLDDQGNQVPVDTVPFIDSFNDKVDYSALPFEEGKTVYDFSADNETNNAIRDAVNAKYNVYGSLDNMVHQFAPAEIGSQHDSLLSTQNPTEVWLGATANGYNLRAKSSNYDNQTMRVSLSLVPKNAAGNEIVTKNFEVSFKLKTQMSWNNGGFMVKFREQTPGYTAYNGGTADTLKPYTQNVALFLSANGAGIWDGAEDSAVNASKWQKPFSDASLVTPYTSGGTNNGTKELDVTLRAVGSTVTAKVAIAGTVVYEETKEVTWLKAGMLSFTGLYGDNVLSNVSLTLLDDNGEPVIPYTEKLEGGAVAVESVNKKGSETDTQFFTTVAPEAGKQLKAGSLRARVKGTDGAYTIMPSRVGFRDAANLQSAQFVFDTTEELEFTAEFYTPASTAEANVAMLATSKSTTETGGSYGNAVRFISRSYIYEDGGKFYMDINGAPMEVADFGMYVTSQMALDKAGYESMEDAIAEGTLRALVKRSIPAAGQEVGKLGIFYDYADGYVDTSIQIINIPSTHLEQQIVSCTYVEFANGDVFLTDAASRSHADA